MGIDLLNLETVDAKWFPLEPDNLHLTTAAQVELARREIGACFFADPPWNQYKVMQAV